MRSGATETPWPLLSRIHSSPASRPTSLAWPSLDGFVSCAWTLPNHHNASGALVFAILIASLVLGILLARFNIFAALVGSAICAASSFFYDISREVAPAQAFLAGVGAAFALQLGYLVTQFLRRQQK